MECVICKENSLPLLYVTVPLGEKLIRKGPICIKHIEFAKNWLPQMIDTLIHGDTKAWENITSNEDRV